MSRTLPISVAAWLAQPFMRGDIALFPASSYSSKMCERGEELQASKLFSKHYMRQARYPIFIFHFQSSEEAEILEAEYEWLQKSPEKTKPLYSHSLPCIEAWVRSLGFYQSREDRAAWFVEKSDWHGQLSLDNTDLSIRFCCISSDD
ncbi:tRNA dimethylallyltransferase [Olea europaea subsp. europaea]|uniref:tRNA dimethylallyltransferase n=1 Tax=Olea europaea subsp. europaea TaxID=158383 RepID=A0A8S0SF82_OLEEU|nr:tRNA dimethylallyltransferase [Olea europaea subsp. europaea]